MEWVDFAFWWSCIGKSLRLRLRVEGGGCGGSDNGEKDLLCPLTAGFSLFIAYLIVFSIFIPTKGFF